MVAPKRVKRQVSRTAVKTAGRKKAAPAARKRRRKPARSLTFTPGMLNVFFACAMFLILLGGGMWLGAWLNNPENLPIQKVEWKGSIEHLQQSELDALVEPYITTNLYLLDAKALEEKLEAHEWVRSVSLHKAWPEQLTINLEEQFPVAFWGQKRLLNQFGEIFEGDVPGKSEIFPMIFSPVAKGREMAERYVRVMKMLDGLGLDIVELTEDESGSWRMKFRQGQEVILGRKEQEKRIKRFRVGYMQELRAKFDDVRLIDLRYTNGFAVEWMRGSGHAGAVGSLGIMMPERLRS
uniref:Cell division protein FtsQ n=1 Tax=uncultured Thiotrichaceae bacterium TaxID=298394 RepID=A0A6S6UHP1_9GAMM|nr:MAG: Cell division protein FtsQ [uncultured Thiotrichaceae bacterium]